MFGKKKEPSLFEEGPALTAAAKGFYALTEQRDFAKAAAAYNEAYKLCGTESVKELALLGEVCMYYGHALRALYNLEAISDSRPPTKDQMRAVQQIRMLWSQTLDIYNKIPFESHRMPAEFVEQIRKHWIMPE